MNLAIMAKRFYESELAIKIARDYMHNYLDKLGEDDFLTMSNR